jgi:hypothetical protein
MIIINVFKETRRVLFLLLVPGGLLLPADQAKAGPALLRFASRDVELRLTEVSDRTIRVTLAQVNTPPLDAGPVLVTRSWPEPAIRLTELPSERNLNFGHQRVSIRPGPLSVELSTKDGKPYQRLVFEEDTGVVRFRLGDGPVLGLGSGGARFDRRKIFDAMNNGHRAGEFQIFGSRIPIPFLIGTEGWGLFFHRPYRGSFDLRDAEGRFEARPEPGPASDRPLPIDVFVIRADSPAVVLEEYAGLTGKPAMPPRWALG